MKFKVIVYNTLPAEHVDLSGNFEFYTQDEAELACTRWVSIADTFKAYLFTGQTWVYYD